MLWAHSIRNQNQVLTYTIRDHEDLILLQAGNRFVGKKTSLPPSVQDNKLFANMVALKLSIAASAMQKTPLGFGELVFDDTTSNPLNGLMLKEIAAKTDTLLTGRPGRKFASADTFAIVNATIERILNAFEGTMDTISFAHNALTPKLPNFENKGNKAISRSNVLTSEPNCSSCGYHTVRSGEHCS